MSGGAPQVRYAAESREIESRDHRRRAQLSKAMHPAQETAAPRIGLEEVVEQGALPAEGLGPAMRAFANGIFQVLPHGVQRFVGIEHITGQGERAVVAQVSFGDGLVGVSAIPLVEQTHSHAGVQQTLQRAGYGARSEQAGGKAWPARAGAFV